MALKHDPATLPTDAQEADTGLHAHTDAVAFTMLTQTVESLEIKQRDGSRFTVPADPAGSLLVIPDDWMELFTNGQIPAVRHQVMDTRQARMSLAFFQSLAPMPVGPLTRFVGAGEEARYPTVAKAVCRAGKQR